MDYIEKGTRGGTNYKKKRKKEKNTDRNQKVKTNNIQIISIKINKKLLHHRATGQETEVGLTTRHEKKDTKI